MPSKSANVKNEKQYEALKDKGMSKQRAARIANAPDSSKHGGQQSGKGSSPRQGGTEAGQVARRAAELVGQDRDAGVAAAREAGDPDVAAAQGEEPVRRSGALLEALHRRRDGVVLGATRRRGRIGRVGTGDGAGQDDGEQDGRAEGEHHAARLLRIRSNLAHVDDGDRPPAGPLAGGATSSERPPCHPCGRLPSSARWSRPASSCRPSRTAGHRASRRRGSWRCARLGPSTSPCP